MILFSSIDPGFAISGFVVGALVVRVVVRVALLGGFVVAGIGIALINPPLAATAVAALLVVVAAAALAGIAFSYRRYFPRR